MKLTCQSVFSGLCVITDASHLRDFATAGTRPSTNSFSFLIKAKIIRCTMLFLFVIAHLKEEGGGLQACCNMAELKKVTETGSYLNGLGLPLFYVPTVGVKDCRARL